MLIGNVLATGPTGKYNWDQYIYALPIENYIQYGEKLMEHKNQKILLVSVVKDMLEGQGWSLYLLFNNEYFFKNTDGEVLSILHHPTNSQLIYLDELINKTHVLRQEFIASAYQQWDIASDKSVSGCGVTDVFHKIKETSKLPTPAHKAFKIFRLAQNSNTDISDLAAVIRTDPAIAARILKVANSAFYKSLKPISSIQEAIVRLGFKMVKRISLGSSLISGHKKGPCADFDYELFWSDSVARAVVTRNLSSFKQSIFSSDETFTVGLLCQIGRLAFATAYPDKYSQVLRQTKCQDPVVLSQNERKVFSIDHNELSAEMMAEWHLPEVFCKAVRFQNSLDDQNNLTPGSPEYELAGLLQWPAKMSIILTQSGVKREFLESVINEATELGWEGDNLGQWFDSIANEWSQMGDILEVKTRKVLPWKEIYNQIA